jgi:hypothetical protein
MRRIALSEEVVAHENKKVNYENNEVAVLLSAHRIVALAFIFKRVLKYIV